MWIGECWRYTGAQTENDKKENISHFQINCSWKDAVLSSRDCFFINISIKGVRSAKQNRSDK